MRKSPALALLSMLLAAIAIAAVPVGSASAAGPTSATGAGTLTILGELRNFGFSAVAAGVPCKGRHNSTTGTKMPLTISTLTA